MHAQGSQQSNRVALLRHRQPTHRPLETLDMGGKHVVDQGAAIRRQLAEHHSRILGTCPPPHQPSLLEFLDDIGRARAGEENAIPDLAEPQSPLVIQHLQDRELGQAQALLNEMRSDGPLKRLKCAAQRDDQLQRCSSVGIAGDFGLLSGSRGHDS